MINNIKVKGFELWDAETGEADITAVFDNNITLKAFTLDHFEKDEEVKVIVSLFCNDFELTDKKLESSITNVKDNFSAKIQGEIIETKFDEEEGNILVVNAGNIIVSVYIPVEDIKIEENQKYFIGSGRLDIETELIS